MEAAEPAHVKSIRCAIRPCGHCQNKRNIFDEDQLRFDWKVSADTHILPKLQGVSTIDRWNEARRCEFQDKRKWFAMMRRARRLSCVGTGVEYRNKFGAMKHTYSYIGCAVSMEIEDRMVAIRELYRLWTLQRHPFSALPIEVIDTIADWLRQFSGVEHHMVKIQRRLGYHNKW